MNSVSKVFTIPAFLLLAISLITSLFAEQGQPNKPSKPDVINKTKRLQIPFIANEGQINEKVKFYANTFVGSVFVTKDGEIVYSQPMNAPESLIESSKYRKAEATGCSPLMDLEYRKEPVYSPLYIVPTIAGLTELWTSKNMEGSINKNPFNYPMVPLLNRNIGGCVLDGDMTECSSSFAKEFELEYEEVLPGEKHKEITGVVTIKEEMLGGKIDIDKVKGEEQTITKVNCFKGGDPSRWKTNISTYDVITLGEVYPGIEIKLKAYGNNVEKLFYVSTNADPEAIKIKLNGAKGLRVNEKGQLEAETALGSIKFTKPLAYQEIDGKRVEVAINYELSTHNTANYQLIYGFKLEDYDRTKTLVIDPLLASTYLGGTDSDTGYSIAIASDGAIYVAGETMSSNFPTDNTYGVSYEASFSGGNDAFITKLNSDLTTILASTYFGGNDFDSISSLVIDSATGNIFAGGKTLSSDFPVTNSTSYGASYDGFVSKLSGDLTSLLSSTYFGGNDFDSINALGIASGGDVYVAGETTSNNLTTPIRPYGGSSDGFVSKLNGDFTSIIATTYLGGNDYDNVSSMVITSNDIYVAGDTSSANFPTIPGNYDTLYGSDGSNGNNDAFVSELRGDLTTISASTYLGGTGADYVCSIIIDSAGNIYVTGETGTGTSNYPTTPGTYDESLGGDIDAFVSKLSGDLTGLLASTFLGGSFWEYGSSMVIDSDGTIYVTGGTASSDFPTTDGSYDTTYNAVDGNGDIDTFVSKLKGDLTGPLLASTYLGGYEYDPAYSIARSSNGDIYVTGVTLSSDFPTTNGAYDRNYNKSEVFVSKFDSNLSGTDNTPPVISNINAVPADTGATITWDTDEAATSRVDYGTTAAYENGFQENTALVTSHSVVLTGLTPGTEYHYKVTSADGTGNSSSTLDLTFTTTNTTPPVISNINAVPTDTGAAITWDTDEAATSRVDYGPTAAYENGFQEDTALITSHSVVLTGLTPGTVYHYKVTSADGTGNSSNSLDLTFTTTIAGQQIHYAFEEGSGTIANDSSGNGNNGTLNGPIWTTGKNGGGLSFDGINDYVSVPRINNDEVSICAWFYKNINDITSADAIFGGWRWNTNTQLREGFDLRFYQLAPDTLEFIVETQNGSGTRTEKTIRRNLGTSVGAWYHVAGTYYKATGEQKLYVNGLLVSTRIHPAGNTIVPLTFYSDMRVGHSRVNNGYFNGIIDDVRLYNRALSDQEAGLIMAILMVLSMMFAFTIVP